LPFTATDVAGAPEIATTVLAEAAATVMLNPGKAAELAPSLALMTMPGNTPAVVGTPVNEPLPVLNVAQPGFPWMENVTVVPAPSVVTGVNA
jgi:hypothetical protein